MASMFGTILPCMMVSGLKIKLTELEPMCGQTVADTKVNGKRITCTAKVSTPGRTAVATKETT